MRRNQPPVAATPLSVSHMLYRVGNVSAAVTTLRDAGFDVEFDDRPGHGFHAFVWFADGPFIELLGDMGLTMRVGRVVMPLIGYRCVLRRMQRWADAADGWCDWAVESSRPTLADERRRLRDDGIPYKAHHGRRTTPTGTRIGWDLIFPHDTALPFIMSAYSPDPRPPRISHPNGARRVASIAIGADDVDPEAFGRLRIDGGCEVDLRAGTGLQAVTFEGSALTVEALLS